MSRKKKKQDVEDTIPWGEVSYKEMEAMTGKIKHKLTQIQKGYRMKSIILDVDMDELEQYVYELRQALPIEEISEYNRRVHERYMNG